MKFKNKIFKLLLKHKSPHYLHYFLMNFNERLHMHSHSSQPLLFFMISLQYKDLLYLFHYIYPKKQSNHLYPVITKSFYIEFQLKGCEFV